MEKRECNKKINSIKKILPSKKLLLIFSLSLIFLFLLSVSSVFASTKGVNNTWAGIITNQDSYGLDGPDSPYGFSLYFNFTPSNKTYGGSVTNITVKVSSVHGDSQLTYPIYFYNTTSSAWDYIGNDTTTLNNTNINSSAKKLRFLVNTSAFNLTHNGSDFINLTILNITNSSSNWSNMLFNDTVYLDFVNISYPVSATSSTFVASSQTYNFTFNTYNDTTQTCQLYTNSSRGGQAEVANNPTGSSNSTLVNGTYNNTLTSDWTTNERHYVAIKCTNGDTGVSYWSKAVQYDGLIAPPRINSITVSLKKNGTATKTGGLADITVNTSDDTIVKNVTIDGVSYTFTNITPINGSNATSSVVWNRTINISLRSSGTLTVTVTDNNSNSVTNQTLTITIDNIAPTTNSTIVKRTAGTAITTDGSVWYNVPIQINLSALDSGECNKTNMTVYRWGTSGAWNVTGGKPFVNITVSTNMTENIIQFKSNDSAGNMELYQQKYIQVDTTAPNLAIRGNLSTFNVTTGGLVVLTVVANDTLSGMSAVTAYHTGLNGTNATLTFNKGVYTGTFMAPTTVRSYIVLINATDNAGNNKTLNTTLYVHNASALAVNLSVANATYVTNQSTITITATNASVVQWNTTSNTTQVNASSVDSFTIPMNFTKANLSITISARSILGLYHNRTYVFYCDTNGPSPGRLNYQNNDIVNGSITLRLTNASDKESGVANVSFYVNGSLEGTDIEAPYTYDLNTYNLSSSTGLFEVNATVTDNAGNVNSTKVNLKIVNSNFSTITVSQNNVEFEGTAVAKYLIGITNVNSTTAKTTVQKTAIITPPSFTGVTLDVVYLSMNITASSVGNSTISLRIPKSSFGLTNHYTDLYSFTTHANGSTEKIPVSRDTVNDDSSNYAFRIPTNLFSVFTIATQKATGTSSGSGGGGGSSSTTITAQTIALTTTEQKITKLARNSKLAFSLSGESHSLTVSSIATDRKNVRFIFESNNKQLFTLNVGDAKLVDVGGDEQFYVKLDTINSREADITVKKVIKPKPLPTIPTPTKEEPKVEPPKEVVIADEEEKQTEPTEEEKSIIGWIIVALVVIIGLGVYFVMKRGKKE